MLAPLQSVLLIGGLALACRSAGSGEPDRTAPSRLPPPSDAVGPPFSLAPSKTASAAPSAGPAPSASPVPSASPETATSVAASATPLPMNDAPRSMRVIVVGDSLSDPRVGGGGYLTQALAACPKARIENLAKGGFMVNQMRRKLEREVRAGLGPATHMVVFGGVNDVYSDETAGRVPHKIIADLSAIYALGRGLGARVIAITISPWGGFSRYYSPKRGRATDEVNTWIRKQVEAGNVAAAVDSTPALSCGDPERLCPDYEPPFHDGLHFGPNGHRALGRSLAPAFADCR